MKSIIIKKGHNLKVDGIPDLNIYHVKDPGYISFHPSRFKSFKTKLLVKKDDSVKVGSPLFFDKNNKDAMYTSTVSGRVSKIIFGKRRIVEAVLIENDKKYKSTDFLKDISKNTLLKSGLWTLLRQKPFSKVPNVDSTPKSFFISSIPTEPFAVNYEFLFKNIENHLQTGIDVLKQIFNCDINVSVSENSSFSNLRNVNFFKFNQLHPSGNVGVQIHHIDPIKDANDTRWYLSFQDLNRIGEYFNNNVPVTHKYYSIGGNGVKKPGYYKAIIGTPINDILGLREGDLRCVSGDLLNGKEIGTELSPDYYDDILSVIKTYHNRDFIGWLMPGFNKYSLSNTFLSKLISNSKSILNTNLNGSVRTIIPMGNWESVLPMNIYPEFLVKSILSKDIEMMEKLGIYESSPEDFALCSFVCQSKVEVSAIIQQGLDLIENEI